MAKEIQLKDADGNVYPVHRLQVVDGTFSTTTVPSGGSGVAVATLTLPKGLWVIMASLQFTASFTQVCHIVMNTVPNGIVRGVGTNGGGLHTGIILNLTSASTTLTLTCYQNSGSNKNINQTMFRAARIA